MKIIKFDIADEAGYNTLESKIHNSLLALNGVDGFVYSAECYCDINKSLVNTTEGKRGLVIDLFEPRYTNIINSLSVDEQNLIEEVQFDWAD